ncbi:phage major capsid protein [Mycobacterium interjectum]|uniref:phage major capsid protein n=1 Tax=Mycobacterium interjectum TaxID=33895 RepID=UPI000835D019|nr:phage major capsid protein [Mycobacterium interjectum]MCV7090024.1 phage major capsid protein [Mycobacterium interjectum]
MAILTTTSGVSLSVDEIAALVVRPLTAASTALRTTTVLPTNNHRLRIPVVTADPQAAFVAENTEIDPSDASLQEAYIDFYKCAALTRVSSETFDDSDPAIANVIGEGIARNIARVVDKCYFAASTTDGFDGIESLTGKAGQEACQVVNVGGPLTNLDPLAEAISRIEAVGGRCTSFCADTSTILALALLKEFGGSSDTLVSNEPLLAVNDDLSQPTSKSALGVPLWPLPTGVIDPGVIWAWDRSRVFMGMRNNVTLRVTEFPYFTADAWAVRSTARLGAAWPHPQAVVKIVSTLSGS